MSSRYPKYPYNWWWNYNDYYHRFPPYNYWFNANQIANVNQQMINYGLMNDVYQNAIINNQMRR